METKTFQAPAIHCGHCTMTIQREVGELAGVTSVKADQNTKMVTCLASSALGQDQRLDEIGYPARIEGDEWLKQRRNGYLLPA
jgi:copper chaperone CopZ